MRRCCNAVLASRRRFDSEMRVCGSAGGHGPSDLSLKKTGSFTCISRRRHRESDRDDCPIAMESSRRTPCHQCSPGHISSLPLPLPPPRPTHPMMRPLTPPMESPEQGVNMLFTVQTITLK